MTLEEFIKSKDFMKLGHAINQANWQIAGMTVSRMQKNSAELEFHEFDRQFIMIKQCIAGRKKQEALNALAGIAAKRAQLLQNLFEE